MDEYKFQYDYVKREEKRKKALKEEAKKESLKEATFSVTDMNSAQDAIGDIINLMASKRPYNQLARLISEAIIRSLDMAIMNYVGPDDEVRINALSNKMKKQLIVALRDSI